MNWGTFSPAVHELAKQSAAGTDPVRLADLAGQVLEESGFQPGFDTEPRLLAELEDALAAVQADMRATGLAGPVRLTFEDEDDSYLRNVFAGFRGSCARTTISADTPREHDSEAVWWCNGGDSGHVIVPIGYWIRDV
jgi:hypothetical protein